jgi:nucleotide-binding universal stress UspA family protein
MISTVPAIEAQTLATEPAAQIIEESDARERVKLQWAVDNGADRLQQAGLVADAMVLDGDPRHEINAEAERWQANSVFVGARGLGALDRLVLGSVSTAVVHQALCAVEVVRQK